MTPLAALLSSDANGKSLMHHGEVTSKSCTGTAFAYSKTPHSAPSASDLAFLGGNRMRFHADRRTSGGALCADFRALAIFGSASSPPRERMLLTQQMS